MCTCVRVIFGIIAVLGIGLIIAGCIIGFSSVLDDYIEEQIAESVRLEAGSGQFERWENLPFPLKFKIYVFNVTNPEEILEGAKPIVEEIGPFVYNQTRNKEDVVYDETDDTLSYKQRLWYDFDEEASALPEDTNITVLNVALQGVFIAMEEMDRVLTANANWKRMFHGDELFLTVSARTFFFDGYQFCIASLLQGIANLTVRQICDNVRLAMEDSKTITFDDDKIEFSFFKHKQNNTDGTYTISAGNEDVNTLGAIRSWEGLQYLDTWNEDDDNKCNRIRGRDSSIYPPYNNLTSQFDIYNTDICKIVTLEATGKTEYEGIEGIMAELSVEHMTNDGDKSCYCIQQTKNLDGEKECLPVGFADMQSCLTSPVLASFPHMLDADETYRSTVEGLEPDQYKHRTFVTIEPDTGTPLRGAKRIQFNMITKPIQGLEITESLSPAVFPIIWVEEGFDLPDEQVQQLKDDYFSKLNLLTIVTYLLIGIGIALVVIGIGYFVVKIFT